MSDAVAFIDLGNILSKLADWLACPEGFTEVAHCSDFGDVVKSLKLPQNCRENYHTFYKTIHEAEEICLLLPETEDVSAAHGILAAMSNQGASMPFVFIGPNASKSDDEYVVHIMRQASADFRQPLLVTSGRLLAKGKRLEGLA